MFKPQRMLPCLLAFCSMGLPATTGAADLISHNSFSECWTQAISKDLFLDAARASVDGLSGCVATQSGNSPAPYSLCNTNACPGSQPGCPVALQATATPSGDFTTGHFSAAGTASDMSVNLAVFQVPCVMTNTGIAFTYSWTNTLQADGNNGRYAGDLPDASVHFDTYTLGGNCQGSVNSLVGSIAVAQAQTAMADAMKPLLTTATVTESVCPL